MMSVAERVAHETAQEAQRQREKAEQRRQRTLTREAPTLVFKTHEDAAVPPSPEPAPTTRWIEQYFAQRSYVDEYFTQKTEFEARFDAFTEGCGEAIGEVRAKLRDDFERELNHLKRDLEQAQSKINAQAELEREREAVCTKSAEADRAELATLRHELRTKCAEARADLIRDLDLVKQELNTRVELERHAKQLRDEISAAREAQAAAGEELLRREVAALREQIGLQQELASLRKQVADAQAQIPQVPALISEVQAEQASADKKIAALSARLTKTQDRLGKARVDQSLTNYRLEELRRAQAAKATIEIETSTQIFAMRDLSPEAAKTLRAFAEQVIDPRDGGPIWIGSPVRRN